MTPNPVLSGPHGQRRAPAVDFGARSMWRTTSTGGDRRARHVFEAEGPRSVWDYVVVIARGRQWNLPQWIAEVLNTGLWSNPGDTIVWDDPEADDVAAGDVTPVLTAALATLSRGDVFSVDVIPGIEDSRANAVVITRGRRCRRVPKYEGREAPTALTPRRRRGPKPATTPWRFEGLHVGMFYVYRADVDAHKVDAAFRRWATTQRLSGAKLDLKWIEDDNGRRLGLRAERLQ